MSYLSESVGDVGTSDRDRLSHLVAENPYFTRNTQFIGSMPTSAQAQPNNNLDITDEGVGPHKETT